MKEKKIMYKFILVFMLVLLFNYCNGQLLKSYGCKVAITSATQQYDYSDGFKLDNKRRIGWGVAIYAEWFNLPIFSMISQIEYIQRGMGLEFSHPGSSSPAILSTETLYQRLAYLSIPILVKLTAPLPLLEPYIFFGPCIDFLLGYKDDFGYSPSIIESYKKNLWGGSVGGGIDFNKILPLPICIEFRYNIDFSNSFSDKYKTIKNSAYDLWLCINI